MPRPKKEADSSVSVEILRDGVFPFDDVRKDKGERATVPPHIAKILIERGHAKPV